MVTVKQLIEILKELPPNAVVVCASDPEGNSYDLLSEGIGNGRWIPERGHREEIDYNTRGQVAIVIGP